MAVVPLKARIGSVDTFDPTDVVSSDGIAPRSTTTLALGDASTVAVSLVQGSESARVIVGAADPTIGPGVAAPEGSIYLRTAAGGGEAYVKTGAAPLTWAQLTNSATPSVVVGVVTSGPIALSTYPNRAVVLIDTAAPAVGIVVNLPAPAVGLSFVLKDVGGAASTFPITVVPAGGAEIEGRLSNYVQVANYGALHLICDGTNWWLL